MWRYHILIPPQVESLYNNRCRLVYLKEDTNEQQESKNASETVQ